MKKKIPSGLIFRSCSVIGCFSIYCLSPLTLLHILSKKQKKTTGNKAVQEVHAARGYYQAKRAIVITSSRYSKPARQLAKQLGVELWNWNQLINEINTRF